VSTDAVIASEAKQSIYPLAEPWIASSQALLAMMKEEFFYASDQGNCLDFDGMPGQARQ
jgi:hypothetical protein